MKDALKFPVLLPACFLLLGVPVFLMVAGIIFVFWLGMRIYRKRKLEKKAMDLYIPAEPSVRPRTEQDLVLEAFGLMQSRITNYLRALYPESGWVWGTPNALKSISEGREAVIHLRNAGGYHRARVIYHDLQFQNLQFVTYGLPEQAKPVSGEKPEPEVKLETDFSLVAFEWMNAKLGYLNAQADDAIFRKVDCFLIEAEEWPDQECGPDICIALKEECFDAESAENRIEVAINGEKGNEMSKRLFTFSRSLPPPYNTLSKKKVAVQSMYGNKTEATLVTGPIKAIHAYLDMTNGGEGALGLCGNKSVAEYKSSEEDIYHLVVFDSTTGHPLATVYKDSTEATDQYTVGDRNRDGAAIFLALLPALMEDEEFKEKMDVYASEYHTGLTDLTAASELMAVLCDNIYRRITDDTCPAHIKVNADTSGNIIRLPKAQLDAGRFIPDRVLAGQFKIFSNTAPAAVLKAPAEIEHENFIGQYRLNPSRILSSVEQSLVPKLEPWYVLPKEIVNICHHAKMTTESSYPMRNFMLRGPAGSGKTLGAKAIAAGLGLPYVKYTCNSNTEIYDFIGQIFPDSAAPTIGNADLDRERSDLEAMGGMTYENVVQLLGLPGVDDMEYDTEGSYFKLTGKTNPSASYQDCVAAQMAIVMEKVCQLSAVQPESKAEGQSFRYVETDFIKALKNGYLTEIQEPATIMQPGVLVGLNSLLEQGGSITLPTGEVIQRHPDAVVVITTNVDYEGCRGLNQSVTDRMGMIYEIPTPEPEVMAQRAMKITGFDDDLMVANMVKVVKDLEDYCRTHAISDGSVGMRGLIDWIMSTQITNNPYESAGHTIVTKAASSYDDQISILTTVVDPVFAAVKS